MNLSLLRHAILLVTALGATVWFSVDGMADAAPSGTVEPIQLAQAKPIPKEEEAAPPEEPSTIDLMEEADERQGTNFEMKARDLRNWRKRIKASYPPAPIDPEEGPTVTGTETMRKACGRAMDYPELLAREQRLSETQAILLEEMERLERIQTAVRQRWSHASAAMEGAQSLQIEAELNCSAWGPGALAPEEIAEENSADPANDAELSEAEIRIQRVVNIMKSMKPKPAARILQGWDTNLAAVALLRLPPRVGSKIVAALPPEIAGQVTTRLAPPAKKQNAKEEK